MNKIKRIIINLIYLGMFFISLIFVTILMFNFNNTTFNTEFDQLLFSKNIINYKNKRKLFFKELNTLDNQKSAIHEAGHALGVMLYPEVIDELNGMHLCDSQNPKKPLDFITNCNPGGDDKTFAYVDAKLKKNNYFLKNNWKNDPKTKTKWIDFEFKNVLVNYLGWMSQHYFFNDKPQSSWELYGSDYFTAFNSILALELYDPKDHNEQSKNTSGSKMTTWPAKVKEKAISIIAKPQNLYIIHLLATALMIEDGSLYETDMRYIFKHQKYPPHIQEKLKTRKINFLYKTNIKNIINHYPNIYFASSSINPIKLWYLVIIFAIIDLMLLCSIVLILMKNNNIKRIFKNKN